MQTARKIKAFRRKQAAALRQMQVKAAENFAEEWSLLFLSFPDHCHMRCTEAEAAAALYRALGRPADAAEIVLGHADYDECGDLHHECTEDCE